VGVKGAGVPEGPGEAGDRDMAVIAEGISKEYPRLPETMFPAVVSIFDRGWLGRRKDDEGAMPDTGFNPEGLDLGDDLDDDDDEDEDEEEEEVVERAPPPPGSGATFWALEDVSFRVPQGAALGVLGRRGSGKTTLMRILGGQCFPTKGRALVREPVSPIASELAKGMGGKVANDPLMAARLLGVEQHRVKPHIRAIEELAGPRKDRAGLPVPGRRVRLAVATSVLVPSSVILLEEAKGMDDEFKSRLMGLLRDRIRSGTSLVLSSSNTEMIEALCDRAILLDGGRIVAEGAIQDVIRASESMPGLDDGPAPENGRPGAEAEREDDLHVPDVVTAFHGWAGLISVATARTSGVAKKRFQGEESLVVEIGLETAVANVEARCSVSFTSREDPTSILRVQQQEALHIARPGRRRVLAEVDAGDLVDGAHDLQVDAVLTHPKGPHATVISRAGGSIRISGGRPVGVRPEATRVRGWDGREAWSGEAEWSVG
jgi:ABC-type polysaccharide/polyol phosphate transport system ATPase subunit